MVLAEAYIAMLSSLRRNSPESQVRSVIKRIQYHGGPTKETQVVRLSNIKKYFKKRFPDFARLVDFPPGLIRDVKRKRAAKLSERENFVVTSDQLADLKRKDTTVEKAVWALLVSGRRVSELLESGFVEDGRTVRSKSLKKKRTAKEERFRLLPRVSVREWLAVVKEVRSIYNGIEVNSINRKINRYLKSAIRPDMSAHKLRGIYANLMWKASGRRQIKTGYIKKILNLESQEIAIHYSSFILE
jgi:integrase